MSLLELIARRSGSDPSNFSLPDVLAEQALLHLKQGPHPEDASESDQVNSFASAQLANELLRTTPEAARIYIDQLSSHGIGERRLLGAIVPGAADILGAAWEEDRLNFVQVTEAMGHLMEVTRNIMSPPPPHVLSNPNPVRVLLVRTPGEDHVLGLRLIAQEMRRHGWLVRVDLSGDLATMAAACTHQAFDFIGFTAADHRRLPALAKAVTAARRMMPDAHIIAGGWLGTLDPDLLSKVGVDLGLGRNNLPVETLVQHFQLEKG